MSHSRYPIPLSVFAALLLALAPSRAANEPADVEIHGPDVHPGYPDVFNLAYKVAPGSVSPDGKYGVIHARRGPVTNDALAMIEDFLVELNPFRIVGVIDADDPYFEGQSSGGLTVTWSADGATALVVMDGKWGPRTVQVLELQNGRIARQTDLVAEVRKQYSPEYKKSKAKPYNGNYDFILDTDGGGEVVLGKNGQVHVQCVATTDPKGIEKSAWSAKVDFLWDVAEGKMAGQKEPHAAPKTK